MVLHHLKTSKYESGIRAAKYSYAAFVLTCFLLMKGRIMTFRFKIIVINFCIEWCLLTKLSSIIIQHQFVGGFLLQGISFAQFKKQIDHLLKKGESSSEQKSPSNSNGSSNKFSSSGVLISSELTDSSQEMIVVATSSPMTVFERFYPSSGKREESSAPSSTPAPAASNGTFYGFRMENEAEKKIAAKKSLLSAWIHIL